MPWVMWVFSKKAAPFAFGGDQFIELLDLVAELDRQRIGLELAGVADGFHTIIPPIDMLRWLTNMRPEKLV